MTTKRSIKGFAAIEALLASALFALIVTAMVGAYTYGNEASALAGNRTRATLLAEEGIEAVRNIRDSSFSSLIDGTAGLTVTGNQWLLSGSSDTTGIFTRTLNVSSVSSNIKQVTSTITWPETAGRNGTLTLTSELSNWLATTLVTGAWAPPVFDSSFDLTVANSGHNTATPLSIAYANNKIYLARTQTVAGSEFLIFDVSNPASPTLLSRRDISGDVNSMVLVGNYAYMAVADNSAELQTLDISDPATIANAGKLTTFNLTNANSGGNNGAGLTITSDGTYLYYGRASGDPFLIFNLTVPSNPGAPIGRLASLVGKPSQIIVSGNYAYVTGDGNSSELQVVNITTKTAPSIAATLDLVSGNTGANALSESLVGTNLFIGRAISAAPELYTVSVANPLVPAVTATLEIGANVVSLAYDAARQDLLLATDDNANDLKVVDVSNPLVLASPFGQLDLDNSPQQVIYNSTPDRAFIASSSTTQELQIVKPN